MRKLLKNIYEYTAFFEKNENGGYTVSVPSLPGLVTEGDNLEDSHKMVKEAIQCYVDGLRKEKVKIPEETFSGSFKVAVAI